MDIIALMHTLTKLGVEYKIFTAKEYLHNPKKIKQSACINIDSLDFNFDAEGRFLGWNTEGINSFKKSLRKK